MINDRRRFWTTLLFIGLFAPFLIVFILSLLTPSSMHSAAPAAPTASTLPENASTAPRQQLATTPATAPALFVAGDGRDLWVVPPPYPPSASSASPFALSSNSEPGYELLYRASNSGNWMRSTQRWPGMPQAVALMLPATSDTRGRSTPYVITRSGAVNRFTLENSETIATLPPGQTVKALTGAADSLFMATWGPRPVASTRPAESPPPPIPSAAPSVPASRPALSPTTNAVSMTAPSPVAASAPSEALPESRGTAPQPAASASTQPGTPPLLPTFNVFWFPPHGTNIPGLKPADWAPLPAFSSPDKFPAPDAASLTALAVEADRVILCWIDPAHPESLFVRTLAYKEKNAAWSAPATTTLAAQDRNAARLFAVTLDHSVYVLWTSTSGNAMSINGGRLAPAVTESAGPSPAPQAAAPFTIPANNYFLTPISLASADAVSAASDLAIAPTENTFIAICLNKDRVLSSLAFDDHGRILSPLTALEARAPQHDMEIGQNIAILLLMVMFSLSLWQWQQKPVTPALPAGMIIAPLHLRGIAFAIDAAIPYLIVLTVFNLWDNGLLAPLTAWISFFTQPQELWHSGPFLWFIAIYFLHVALGELFFRRSIGKAITGIEVLMLDGKSPTLAAIIIRNLVRIPETILGLVVIYILISDQQQRLGDLLARTVVVSGQPPETPPDPDKEPPAKE